MSERSVLILSYYFPPTPTVGGLRAAGLAKFLPSFGWQPTVITTRNADRGEMSIPVIETDDHDLAQTIKRRLGLPTDSALKNVVTSSSGPPVKRHRARAQLIELVKAIIAIPDTNRRWSRVAADAALALRPERRFDAVITTSPPPSVHLAGARLARAGLPWLADLRDPWWNNHNSAAPRWRKRLDRFIEVRTLRHAKALTTVSGPIADGLGLTHPSTPAHAILSGFDPDLVNPGIPTSPEFTFIHTGDFHQGRRDPALLFSALKGILESGRLPRKRTRIRLFARHEGWIGAMARNEGIEDVIDLAPWAPREQIIKAQREAQILLLIHPDGPQEIPVYTGKIFEYLAAQRPILMVGGEPGVLSELIQTTKTGAHVRTAQELQEQVLKWWDEFDAEGKVLWRGDPVAVKHYSQVRMARQFADVLDSIV